MVAYFSALCNLRFTAAAVRADLRLLQHLGRLLTGASAGALIEHMGFVNFYLLTTAAALPGILLFWYMMRTGMVDRALGDAGTAQAKGMSDVLPAGTRVRAP